MICILFSILFWLAGGVITYVWADIAKGDALDIAAPILFVWPFILFLLICEYATDIVRKINK